MRLTEKDLFTVVGRWMETPPPKGETVHEQFYRMTCEAEDAKGIEEVDGVLGQDVSDEFYAWAEPNAAKLVPMTKTKAAALAFKAGQESRMVGIVGECKPDRRAELLELAGKLACAKVTDYEWLIEIVCKLELREPSAKIDYRAILADFLSDVKNHSIDPAQDAVSMAAAIIDAVDEAVKP